MLTKEKKLELERFSKQIQMKTIETIASLGVGHVGGALSIADLLAVLYGKQMNVRPEEPRWEDRDWLVVSKGHAGPAVYSALALRGFFPLDQLYTLNQSGTHLPSHCDRNLTTGIDITTGSLGQGASSAAGVALALQTRSAPLETFAQSLRRSAGMCRMSMVTMSRPWMRRLKMPASRKRNRA